jgi:hypothetical protein
MVLFTKKLLFIFSDSAAQSRLWPPRSRGFVITHNDAPQPVGLIWTSDQFVAETSTWQHTQQTYIHAPGGILTHDCSMRAALDLSLRPRGHWDRHLQRNTSPISVLYFMSLIFRTKCNVTTMERANSLAFVPADFYQFSLLQSAPKWRCFCGVADIANATEQSKTLSQNGFKEYF